MPELFPIFVPQGKSKTRYRVGYIDHNGRVAIDPSFNEGTTFAEGTACVQVSGGRWGVIDTTGSFVIRPELWNWCRFHDGLAPLATKSGKWGVIDTDGNFVVRPIYDSIGPFENGRALARIGEGKEARFGFLDRAGAEVIPLTFRKARHFSEGLAAVRVGELWGYILPNGVFQITPRFEATGNAKRYPDTRAGAFAEGLAPVWVGQDHYRFIDTRGSFVFERGFDDANSFSEGRAVAKQGNRFGYIDKDGKTIIACRYTLARDFSEGLARVEVEGSRSGFSPPTGFINCGGNMVIPPRFYSATDFVNGLSLVSLDDSIGYINKSGEFVWQGAFVDYAVVF
ncbi:MAG: WG repeat-containing protein [Acidobacteriota bacterium]